MKKRIYFVTLLIFMCLATACGKKTSSSQFETNPKANLKDMECYKPFEEFAWIFPDIADLYAPREDLLPTEPWQIEAVYPDEWRGEHNLGIEVMFSRVVNDELEIWLARPDRYLKEDIKSVLIYYPATKEWVSVADVVKGTDVFIGELFLTSDGTIWGRNVWERSDNQTESRGPIISKFNEKTMQFEFVQGVLEIPFTNSNYHAEILLDKQDVFWFLLEGDGIYHFDPNSQMTTKQMDLLDIYPIWATLSMDRSIYFVDHTYSKFVASGATYGLYDGLIYQYILDSNELVEFDIPEEPWPEGKPFVTQANHLWLGAIGYKDLNDDSWHLLHPDPSFHFELGFWSHSPSIILESSDGTLWFREYFDQDVGTAWFDPRTMEGCVFTNVEADIVEDERNQLWMFADGKLYRLALDD